MYLLAVPVTPTTTAGVLKGTLVSAITNDMARFMLDATPDGMDRAQIALVSAADSDFNIYFLNCCQYS